MVLAISLYRNFTADPQIKGKTIKTNNETDIDIVFTETPGNKIERASGM
jgi:hypothetical protein